jgi:hypothetical protein
MTHYGNLGDRSVPKGVHDVRGATIHDSDGAAVGKINDVLFDHDRMSIDYVVVDSGGWFGDGAFLIPANRLSVDEGNENGLATGVTRKQIGNSPRYDEHSLRSKDDWKQYEQRFKEYWEDQPVMHIKGSDRIITPPEEPEASRESRISSDRDRPVDTGINAAELFPERISRIFSDPEPSGSKITLRPKPVLRAEEAASGVNLLKPRWWGEFENYLRENKSDVQAKCSECSSQAA